MKKEEICTHVINEKPCLSRPNRKLVCDVSIFTSLGSYVSVDVCKCIALESSVPEYDFLKMDNDTTKRTALTHSPVD